MSVAIALWVAVGSALGGVARYWCSGIIANLVGETFPWGTLIVNVMGSFLIGLIATVSGTDTGGFMGLPPTGKAFRVPAVFAYALANGQITRWQTVYDFAGVLIQIGMLRAKPV